MYKYRRPTEDQHRYRTTRVTHHITTMWSVCHVSVTCSTCSSKAVYKIFQFNIKQKTDSFLDKFLAETSRRHFVAHKALYSEGNLPSLPAAWKTNLMETVSNLLRWIWKLMTIAEEIRIKRNLWKALKVSLQDARAAIAMKSS